VRAHRGRQNFRRKLHVFGVYRAGEHDREFDETGDLVEQPGVWFDHETLARSGRLEILLDRCFAAVLIQYDMGFAEAMHILGCVGDADLAR
jgi:hypothetical protein